MLLEIPGYELVPGLTQVYRSLREREYEAQKLSNVLFLCRFTEPTTDQIVNNIRYVAEKIHEEGLTAEGGLERVVAYFPDDILEDLANNHPEALSIVKEYSDQINKPRDLIFIRNGLVSPKALEVVEVNGSSNQEFYSKLFDEEDSTGLSVCLINMALNRGNLIPWQDMEVLLKHKTYGSKSLCIEGDYVQAEKVIRHMYSVLDKDNINLLRDGYQQALNTCSIIAAGRVIQYIADCAEIIEADTEKDISQAAEFFDEKGNSVKLN